jgi:gluconolactonase
MRMAILLSDAGLSKLLAPKTELRRLAGGFEFTEGPLWLADGRLRFQDIKASRSYQIDLDGKVSIIREETRAANGQTFTSDGWIVFCEQDGRRVSRMKVDGSQVETVVEEYRGKRLNSPNDVICRSDGLIYFTDPPYGAPPDRPLNFQGVYSLDQNGNLTLLLDDFEKPNGLALSPDERILYICYTARYHIRAYDVLANGELDRSSGRIAATMAPDQPGGPDGMKIDRDGRLYVAVALGVWVFEPDGRLLGIVSTPKRPANLAWGGPEGKTLAITMVDEVLSLTFEVEGCLPRFRPE